MSILIACPPPALARAHALRSAITASPGPEWSITNKYYTARVPVRVVTLLADDEPCVDVGDALALIYAFTSSVRPPGLPARRRPDQISQEHASPPPRLRAAITPALELVYTVRLPSQEKTFDPERDEAAADGFGEYVDLSLRPLDDTSDAFNEIKDALQTVPWPTMVRKPIQAARARAGDAGVKPIADPVDITHKEDDDDDALEAWLDADDPFPAPARVAETFTDDFLPSSVAGPSSEEADAFTPFHSAPAAGRSASASAFSADDDDDDAAFLPYDPAPLLAHLTTVRSHLAAIPDPDERRMSAARHVERLFAGLGIDLDSDEYES